MKSPDEIKRGLKCCTYATCNGCPYAEDGCATNQEMIDALEYIHQLEAAQPKWISVEERLPDVGEKVMVCGVKNGMQVGAFRGLSPPGENRKWWWNSSL